MVRKVSADGLKVIKLMMRMMPELFWAHHDGWCGLPYSGVEGEYPQCSRVTGHEGPHVAALSDSPANGSPPKNLKLCDGTEPWYDE